MVNFLLALWLATALATAASEKVCDNVYPHLSCGLNYLDESSCESAGCCWAADETNGETNGNCFAPKIYGYSYQETSRTAAQVLGTLSLNAPSGIVFGADFPQLAMSITQESRARTHIKISPPTSSGKRWEIQESVLPRPGGLYSQEALTSTTIKSQNDDIYDTMEILVTRTPTQTPGTPEGTEAPPYTTVPMSETPISDTPMAGEVPASEVLLAFKSMVFQDQYIQIVLGTPWKSRTYGIGESSRLTQALQLNTTYTLWNTDWAAADLNTSLYGSHPFYLQVGEDGSAHGVLFLNTNAMDVTLTQSDTLGNAIGIQSTGGLIDIYVFAGPTPADVVRQYQEVVGRPAMVPYWSLGFHNCKWGYTGTTEVEEVVANYSAANIPLETQWMDIDYMSRYWDFTLDEARFPLQQTQTFIDTLHKNGQRFVPIVDPGIYVKDQSYSAYTEGVKMDVFVKDMHGDAYLSQVWPGPTNFPDWYAPNTQAYWSQQISQFHSLLAFDGLWIDMNEASNFCNLDGRAQVCELTDDPCASNECCLLCSTPDATNKYDFPPFLPHVPYKSMGGKTIAMSALHAPADADGGGSILEYNAHNTYGLMEARATRQALLDLQSHPHQKPFVLSRSTSMGSGRHTAHWTGDNAATWTDLRVSITTMNTLSLFGMSMTGADICGFMGDTTEELCARWIEVGAFSPFSRNHNSYGQMPQELYRWDSVAEASRTALGLRYQLLPHLYTLMYEAHSTGATVLNAMWVNYPSLPEAHAQEGQYMWSDSVLFTPVLEQGATAVEGFFPEGLWYSLFDQTVIDSTDGGTFLSLPTLLTATNAHLRGGCVIPTHTLTSGGGGGGGGSGSGGGGQGDHNTSTTTSTTPTTTTTPLTTTASIATPFTLLVALDRYAQAQGRLYLNEDNGVQQQGMQQQGGQGQGGKQQQGEGQGGQGRQWQEGVNSTMVSFHVSHSTLTATSSGGYGGVLGAVEVRGPGQGGLGGQEGQGGLGGGRQGLGQGADCSATLSDAQGVRSVPILHYAGGGAGAGGYGDRRSFSSLRLDLSGSAVTIGDFKLSWKCY